MSHIACTSLEGGRGRASCADRCSPGILYCPLYPPTVPSFPFPQLQGELFVRLRVRAALACKHRRRCNACAARAAVGPVSAAGKALCCRPQHKGVSTTLTLTAQP